MLAHACIGAVACSANAGLHQGSCLLCGRRPASWQLLVLLAQACVVAAACITGACLHHGSCLLLLAHACIMQLPGPLAHACIWAAACSAGASHIMAAAFVRWQMPALSAAPPFAGTRQAPGHCSHCTTFMWRTRAVGHQGQPGSASLSTSPMLHPVQVTAS
jgi:hypothetical protein